MLTFFSLSIFRVYFVPFIAAVCIITMCRSAKLTHVLYLVFLLHRTFEF